ncbi:MAG TPA: hypothetical protein VGO63_03630 [Candidatus Paceibacterota bacterium]|jgi:hypothetical protein|nr:hypothetical protein [Candidatus Paceibacterota bacterium]
MENNDAPKNKLVKTYAEDMAHVLEDDKRGMIKKIIHGEDEHDREKRNLSPQSKKNRFFMVIGALLLFISVAGLSYFVFQREAPSVPVERQFAPVIFSDKNTFVELSGLKKDEISKKISDEVNAATVKAGGIEGIYLTLNKDIIGLRKFLEQREASFVPGDPGIIDDNFLIGAFKSDIATTTPNSFFMLLKVRSITDIFAPMRAWEPKMFTDLHEFFGIPLSADTKYLLTPEFQDGIIQNKNSRILYDKDNKIVMMYVFADDTSVVITNSENATREIILRLAGSQIKK